MLPPVKENYTIKEISDFLGINTGTIHGWINSKRLKANRQDLKNFLVNRQDLKEFFANPPTSKTRGLIKLLDRNLLKIFIDDSTNCKY
jgi:excisionase family DNA binding protein